MTGMHGGASLDARRVARHATRNLGLAVLVLAALALLSAPTFAAPSRHLLPAKAKVVGKVMFCGGPPPGRCFVPHQRGTVTAYDSHHHQVAQVDGSRGHFRFHLMPGRYTITARYPGAAKGTRALHIRSLDTRHIRIRVGIH